jgi:PST family polysaccharide transporter
MSIAVLVLTWWASEWSPGLPTRGSGVLPLLQFGAHLTASSVISRLARGIDNILIGRFFGAESLGLYSRAAVLLVRPLDQLLAPADAVLVPVLSRLQADPERYRRAFLRVNEALAVLSFVGTALFLALSRPVVLLLLGPAWEGAVALFAGFTLAALYMPLAYTSSWLFTTQGRGRDWFRVNVVLSLVTVGAFFAGLPYGPLGVILAYSASGLLIRLPLLYYMAGRSGPVRTRDLWAGFACNLPCWLAVYGATSFAQVWLGASTPVGELAFCAPIGLVAGVLSVLTLKRPRLTALYVFRTLKSSLGRERAAAPSLS